MPGMERCVGQGGRFRRSEPSAGLGAKPDGRPSFVLGGARIQSLQYTGSGVYFNLPAAYEVLSVGWRNCPIFGVAELACQVWQVVPVGILMQTS